MSSDFGVAAVVSDAAVATATVPFDVGNVAAVPFIGVGDTAAVVEKHARSWYPRCLRSLSLCAAFPKKPQRVTGTLSPAPFRHSTLFDVPRLHINV